MSGKNCDRTSLSTNRDDSYHDDDDDDEEEEDNDNTDDNNRKTIDHVRRHSCGRTGGNNGNGGGGGGADDSNIDHISNEDDVDYTVDDNDSNSSSRTLESSNTNRQSLSTNAIISETIDDVSTWTKKCFRGGERITRPLSESIVSDDIGYNSLRQRSHSHSQQSLANKDYVYRQSMSDYHPMDHVDIVRNMARYYHHQQPQQQQQSVPKHLVHTPQYMGPYGSYDPLGPIYMNHHQSMANYHMMQSQPPPPPPPPPPPSQSTANAYQRANYASMCRTIGCDHCTLTNYMSNHAYDHHHHHPHHLMGPYWDYPTSLLMASNPNLIGHQIGSMLSTGGGGQHHRKVNIKRFSFSFLLLLTPRQNRFVLIV